MQWRAEDGPDSIMMLTTDLALAMDDGYRPYAEMYADDFAKHNADFASAWFHLTSADMGPHVRCIGDLVPEPQYFQHSLPTSPTGLPDYVEAGKEIMAYLDENPEKVPVAIELALNCASTFRATDYRGGCNGARIRFPPEFEWESNAAVIPIIADLENVKTTKGLDDVSMADMIVLTGIMALEKTNQDLDIP